MSNLGLKAVEIRTAGGHWKALSGLDDKHHYLVALKTSHQRLFPLASSHKPPRHVRNSLALSTSKGGWGFHNVGGSPS